MPWFDFACKYVDMKWPRAAGKSRAGKADALASVTPALLKTTQGAPDSRTLRRALTGWAFNTKTPRRRETAGSGAGVEVAGLEYRAGVPAQ